MKAIICVLVLLLQFSFTNCSTNYKSDVMANKDHKGNAPEFPEGLDWLNTDKPIKLSDLKGKIVLLDFWTFCCINCMHIIPDLKKLEAKYPDELVVIGVHSAKFLTEQGTDNIRQAILRYEIEHPVVNDKDFKVWNSYGANAWPTLVLIDPKGDIVGSLAGEGIFDTMDKAIGKLAKDYANSINRTHLALNLEKNKKPKSLLNFPGKILADEASGRLFITDSNNNRIIISDLNGNIIDIIGSGSQGQKDGDFTSAEFFHPQGLALDSGDMLYIADTENHLIRKADLKNKKVVTIAGIGKQVYDRNPMGQARQTGLNSPWDLTIDNGVLYIAMAGPHQIWAIDLASGTIRLHAGSGVENIHDANLKSASLAQPSGITTDGKKLYFADSEVSAVRSADIDPNGKVSTIIGHGLFEFGDIDGDAEDARFQHPLGIVYVDKKLYLADTYNNKIKVVDPLRRISRTFAGSGKVGMQDGAPRDATFNEPGGISYAKGKLYLADTNNHLIRVVDINNGQTSTLVLKGIDKLRTPFVFNKSDFKGETKIVNDVNLAMLKNINLNLTLPAGYHLNSLAPSELKVFSKDGKINIGKKITSNNIMLDLENPGHIDKLYAEMVVYYCREGNEGLCLIKDVLYEINNSSSSKQEDLKLDYAIMTMK
ncbi:MAG: thioredoxin-like domain-containing protein [Bacteroidota bacterium]|nr:thioredoxin-like domain-containing protein [Bacteroidota bacterium]MDP4191373.1 thioredoxin-like domain-containing protein [Bacteroidota bacterium]MDP4194315.1 thioredoxin-like domain-containing protein [Bacteroidota bacterium]